MSVSNAAGANIPIRAAANSNANGNPSRCRHNAATSSTFCAVSAKWGAAACAPSTKSTTAGVSSDHRHVDAGEGRNRQRGHRQDLFMAQMQGRTARGQDLQHWTGGEEGGHQVCGGSQHVFTVVQDEEHLPTAQSDDESVLERLLRES